MPKHIPVLLEEAITALNLREDMKIVDATLGYAGHSSQILKKIKRGHLFAFDQDSEAIRQSTDRLSPIGTNFTIYHSNFKNLKEKLNEDNIYKVKDERGRVYKIDHAAILESCNSSRTVKSSTYDFGRHDFAVTGKVWSDFLDEIEYETQMEVDSAFRRRYDPWIELIDRDGTIYDAEITRYHDGTYEFRSENMSLQY